MIVDTSALLSIILKESDASKIAAALHSSSRSYLCAANYLEALMVLQSRKGDSGRTELSQLLSTASIEIVDFTEDQADLAHKAFKTYGKGRHPAGLNFGDCMAYALAKDMGKPLLFKGLDFPQTDIAAVPY